MRTIKSEKLQKVLAQQGCGSRRQMEQWIEAGRIKVNGQRAEIGDRVVGSDQIRVDGRLLRRTISKTRVILYHKPEGEVCTRSDPEGRPTVFKRLPHLQTGRWVNIGRLDINTSGLLLFTNDGEVANRLMHPSNQVEREYAVRITGEADGQVLTNLSQGVKLDDGFAKFTKIVDAGGRGLNHWYHVIVTEGRNRLVRRLWQSQGITVNRLIRVRYEAILLPRSLRQGQWRELAAGDVDELMKIGKA